MAYTGTRILHYWFLILSTCSCFTSHWSSFCFHPYFYSFFLWIAHIVGSHQALSILPSKHPFLPSPRLHPTPALTISHSDQCPLTCLLALSRQPSSTLLQRLDLVAQHASLKPFSFPLPTAVVSKCPWTHTLHPKSGSGHHLQYSQFYSFTVYDLHHFINVRPNINYIITRNFKI